jgi:hypothetical protein
MNDEVKATCLYFIVHRSAFIVFFSSLGRPFMVRARAGARGRNAKRRRLSTVRRWERVLLVDVGMRRSLQQALESAGAAGSLQVYPEELKPV